MASSVSLIQPPCHGRVLCQELCARPPVDYNARQPHRLGSMGSTLSFLSLSTGSKFVEQLALPAVLGRRRQIEGRGLSLSTAALRLLGRPLPTIQFPFPVLWLRRQHFGPGHAIQPSRPAASQGIFLDTLFSALRARDDGRRDESSHFPTLPLCLRSQ